MRNRIQTLCFQLVYNIFAKNTSAKLSFHVKADLYISQYIVGLIGKNHAFYVAKDFLLYFADSCTLP